MRRAVAGHRISLFRLDLQPGMEGVTCPLAANSIRVMRSRAGAWESASDFGRTEGLSPMPRFNSLGRPNTHYCFRFCVCKNRSQSVTYESGVALMCPSSLLCPRATSAVLLRVKRHLSDVRCGSTWIGQRNQSLVSWLWDQTPVDDENEQATPLAGGSGMRGVISLGDLLWHTPSISWMYGPEFRKTAGG